MRLPDWPQRLDRFVRENRQRPFRWGSWDCCTFCADAVREMTGRDFAAGFRGRYRTAHGAARFWIGTGFQRFISEVATGSGLVAVETKAAQRGDVVLILENRQTLGVVTLSADAVWCVTPAGLIELPPRLIQAAWRV